MYIIDSFSYVVLGHQKPTRQWCYGNL